MISIQIPDEQAAALKARAAAQGLTLEAWLRKLAETDPSGRQPKKSAYGLLAAYGPGPSADEIDENRREIFRRFADESR